MQLRKTKKNISIQLYCLASFIHLFQERSKKERWGEQEKAYELLEIPAFQHLLSETDFFPPFCVFAFYIYIFNVIREEREHQCNCCNVELIR